mgnify:FL=1
MNQNQFNKSETHWAFLAGLLEGRASISISAGRRLRVTLWLQRHVAAALRPWLKEIGRAGVVHSKGGYHWVHFSAREAGKVLTRCHEYLVSPLRKAECALAFRFARTVRRRGERLLSEEIEERRKVVAELSALHKKP